MGVGSMEILKKEIRNGFQEGYSVSKDELSSMLDLQTFTLKMIVEGASLSAILNSLALKLEVFFNRKTYCSIMLTVEGNKLSLEHAPNLPMQFKKALQLIEIGPKQGSCGTATYLNESVIADNIETDPLWENYRHVALKFGLKACWSIPIHIDGIVVGTFAIYHIEPSKPIEHELKMLETCSYLAGLAIERDRRKQLEKEIRDSEQRFKSLFDYYPNSIYIFSLDGHFLGFNKVTEPISGYRKEELIGKSFVPLIAPEDKDRVLEHFRMAKKGYNQHFECKIIHKNHLNINLTVTYLPIKVNEEVVGVYGIARDITYEKQLELNLQETHREIEHLFDNHQGMIYKIRKIHGQFIHTYGGGKLLERTGLQLEDCIGKSLYEFLPFDVASKKELYYKRAWSGKETCYEGEINGIHYIASLRPIFQEGNVVEVIVSCNDITELKKVYEDLSSTKELLESFINNTVDAIATMDLNGNISFVNQAYVEMFGWKEHEVIGNKVQIIPEKYKEEFGRYLQIAHSGGYIRRHETERQRKDGTLIPVSVTHSPIISKSGEVSGAASIIRDITDQKRITEELEESRQRYRNLFYSNPDLVYTLDLNGVLVKVNPSIKKLLGYTPEQVIGSNFRTLIDKESLDETNQYFETVLKGIPKTFETICLNSMGQRVIFQVTNIPIVINEEIVGAHGIAKDITEKKQTEELLRKSDRLSAIGQLAAGIAHEVRNPLTTIKGFFQFLKEKNNEIEYFDIILREIERIDLITNEFLILAKPQAKIYHLKSIKTILTDFLPLIETQAVMNNVQIDTVIDDNLPPIYCEVNQIKQVFLNILKNSIESMPTGGNVQVSVTQEDANIYIRIEDQGCGIPSQRLKTIGEPFYSTKEKGTGLGLMVSFNIIKEHKGTIKVQSEVGKGTIIEIRLPFGN